jgi:DNA-binding MarR family transcriptional regulator
MSRLQFCLLKLVALNADLQVGELARCLAVSPAVASKNIDKLERLGLVSRSGSPDDRRAILLSVSDEGRRLVQEYERLKADHIAPAVSSLGEENLDHLCSLLEQVCGRLMGEDEGLLERTCLRCAGYYRADCSLGYLQHGCLLHERRATQAGLDEAEGAQ